MRMLSGFTSRWTTPRECAWASALATRAPSKAPSPVPLAPRRARRPVTARGRAGAAAARRRALRLLGLLDEPLEGGLLDEPALDEERAELGRARPARARLALDLGARGEAVDPDGAP